MQAEANEKMGEQEVKAEMSSPRRVAYLCRKHGFVFLNLRDAERHEKRFKHETDAYRIAYPDEVA